MPGCSNDTHRCNCIILIAKIKLKLEFTTRQNSYRSTEIQTTGINTATNLHNAPLLYESPVLPVEQEVKKVKVVFI